MLFRNRGCRQDCDCNCNDEEEKKKLAGAKFALLCCDGNEIACGITDENGELSFENLPLGRYCLKELAPPYGYQKQERSFEVELTVENNVKIVACSNKPLTGCVTVIKYAAD